MVSRWRLRGDLLLNLLLDTYRCCCARIAGMVLAYDGGSVLGFMMVLLVHLMMGNGRVRD